jgi:hypothetical protein
LENSDTRTFQSRIDEFFEGVAAELISFGQTLVQKIEVAAQLKKLKKFRSADVDISGGIKRGLCSEALRNYLNFPRADKPFESFMERNRIRTLVARARLGDFGLKHADGTTKMYRKDAQKAA